MAAEPRLLVSLEPSEELTSALRTHLPEVPWAYVGQADAGPWPEAEAILTSNVPRELAAWTSRATPRLRFVQSLWTGLDRFPFDRFPPAVLIAGNVGAYAPAVAEHAVALLLALAHDLRGNHDLVQSGRLRPTSPRRDLGGGVVLLLGFGEIAREVVRLLRPWNVRVRGVSRRGDPAPEAERMYPASALPDALGEADFVVDSRPLTTLTRATIDRDALERMRPTAVYVNVGRAGTVVERDLFEHLRAHPEFRAGLDVWWGEDYSTGTLRLRFPFANLPNFLGSPHNASESHDEGSRGFDSAARNLARFFSGQTPAGLAPRAEYAPGA
jgi:phosphoglycerate dehydrogenase-like enzyme